ncbi:endolytic transglycosylase MltG [Candidatus Dojkabacteria bacterium]|nr:endolytic transglycosylase MltG [Candidatus Dojkabacteria bacterium]
MEQTINRRNKKAEFGVMKIMLYMIFFLIAFVIGAFFWYQNEISSPLSSSDQVTVVNIEKGENRFQIGQKLKDLGIIKNMDVFVWYVKLSGKGSEIKAGGHSFKKNINIKELVVELTKAPDETTVWVTIPEGLRYDEIAEIINKAFVGKKDVKFDKEVFLEIAKNPQTAKLKAEVSQFLIKNIEDGKSIEGFLYPDTYNFFANATTEEIVNTLVENLIKKLDSLEKSKLENSKYSLYEILTIASMLERESYTEDEAKMVADVIIKRLEGGYFLGIDATTLYEQKDWKAELTNADFEEATPYNTRKVMGLPPTPISNPGISTIRAVIDPTQNDYYFYLHDDQNKVYYAKTNAEHEANKRKHL